MARSNNRLLILAAALLLPLAFVVSAWAEDDLIARLQQSYSRTKTYRSKFVQEAKNKQTGLTTVTKGTVAFRRPGMMRWEYDEPHDKSIITDGFTIWIYLPSQKRVYMEMFSQYYASQLPVLFLSGKADLREQFDVAEQTAGEDGLVPIELKPKVPTPGFIKLTLMVDAQQMRVVATLFVDAYGNTTRIDFTDIETDIDIPESHFNFVLPEGVEVISTNDPM